MRRPYTCGERDNEKKTIHGKKQQRNKEEKSVFQSFFSTISEVWEFESHVKFKKILKELQSHIIKVQRSYELQVLYKKSIVSAFTSL